MRSQLKVWRAPRPLLAQIRVSRVWVNANYDKVGFCIPRDAQFERLDENGHSALVARFRRSVVNVGWATCDYTAR